MINAKNSEHGSPTSMDGSNYSEMAAKEGIDRALDNALRSDPEWADKAYEFLKEYASKNAFFISEDVSDESKLKNFKQPPTDRAWGSIYRKACHEGLIEIDGTGRSRRRHGSICPRWHSLIYFGASN